MTVRLGIALLLLCAHSLAVAALGGLPSSFLTRTTQGSDPNGRRLATIERTQFDAYKVDRKVQESGTVVSEFVGPDNVVFAVSWQGPILPDLKELLGTYFGSFKTPTIGGLRMRSLGSPMLLKSDDVVMQSLGRMRAFRGHAYIPSLVPANVRIDDLLQ